MAEYNFGSVWDRENLAKLKSMADDVNIHGKRLQDLVADGQLTPEQYAELLTEINGLIPSEDFDVFKSKTGASLGAMAKKIELDKMPEPIIKENLWVQEELTLGNLSLTTGDVVDNSNIYVTPHKAAQANTDYTYSIGELYQATATTFKVAYYDDAQTFISGEEFLSDPPNSHRTLTTPAGTAFIRISVAQSAKDTFAAVVGTEPYTEADEGTEWDGGFWDDVPSPPLRDKSVKSANVDDGAIMENHINQYLLDKMSANNKRYPNPPTMDFNVFSNDVDIPHWMDETGETIYVVNYFQLKQTRDEYATLENIGAPFDKQIRGVRILDDGQLLVSTSRDEAELVKASAWKSDNYDINNPGATTFTKVHEATGEAAEFYNHWGMDVYKNIVLLGEYGTKTGTGARRVYLSEDDAETFREIFWQESVYAEHGIPYDAASAHVHTVKYDPYFQRIWVVCGDGINAASFYSDDLGINWKVVEGSTGLEAVQYTGIAVLPDCVVFGSDRDPNGLHIWERTTSRADSVTIKPWSIINDIQETSHIFQMPFQRAVGEPVYFGSFWDKRAGDGKAVIMSFINKDSVQVVYEVPVIYGAAIGNLGAQHVIGETINGNVYTAYYDGTNWNIARAQAPEWITV